MGVENFRGHSDDKHDDQQVIKSYAETQASSVFHKVPLWAISTVLVMATGAIIYNIAQRSESTNAASQTQVWDSDTDFSGVVKSNVQVSGSGTAATLALTKSSNVTAFQKGFGFSPGGGFVAADTATKTRLLDEAKNAHASWFRIDMSWSNIEKTPGVFTWTKADEAISMINAKGLKPLVTLDYSNSLYNGGQGSYVPPTDPSTYAHYASEVVKRYSPQGVKYWEVWNEPNITFWQPTVDPEAYARLLIAAYKSVKAADPQAIVVTAGLAPASDTADGTRMSPLTFLSRVYAAGAKGYFDAVGMHPYHWSYPCCSLQGAWLQMYSTSPSIRSIMTANGDGGKPIWATEYGSPAPTTYRTEQQQADDLNIALPAWKTYTWGGPLFIYTVEENPNKATTDRERYMGLVRIDYSLKPAYNALATNALNYVPVDAGYAASGTAMFRYDATQTVDWTDLTVSATAPSGSSIVTETRSSTDNATWTAWQAGIANTANGRYIEIRETLRSDTGAQTPTIDKVSLGFSTIDVVTTTPPPPPPPTTTPPPPPTTTTDTTAPSVAITVPTAGTTLFGNSSVLTAAASDNVGIASVQFKIDGVNLGTLEQYSPYSISWNTTAVANGTHILTAYAKDAAGNATTSAPVSVTVQNANVSQSVEAELGSLYNTTIYSDSAASGGRSVKLYGTGSSASYSFAVAASGSYKIGATLKSIDYKGSAQADVYVDNVKVIVGQTINTSYTFYYVTKSYSAGTTHTIKVVFINDRYRSATRDRNLLVDQFRLTP